MPYDEFLADRINSILKEKGIPFTHKKMMGGLVFMMNDKMLCGIHISKKFGDSLLMARIGEEACIKYSSQPECLPMNFTGRSMKGYIFVTPDGFDLESDLAFWLQLAIDFNPKAKASKKK